jgi:hypothetical protein
MQTWPHQDMAMLVHMCDGDKGQDLQCFHGILPREEVAAYLKTRGKHAMATKVERHPWRLTGVIWNEAIGLDDVVVDDDESIPF